MKQEDRLSFVNAMEKEIRDHEEGFHWTIVNRNTIPNKDFPIKEFWSFKRKCKPYGEQLKHKSRLCVHYSRQKWGDSYWET